MAQTMTGARAVVYIQGKALGIFSSVSFGMRQGKEPLFTIGRFSPAEIVATSQEAMRLSMTGFRAIDAGPYAAMGATKLRNLLDEGDFTVKIQDRQTGKYIWTVDGCKVEGFSSGAAARGVTDVRLDIIGLVGYDESGVDDEAVSATKITDGI